MHRPMPWSEPHVEGFLLAATLASDRAAREALPGLTRAARSELQAAAGALDRLDTARRRRHIAALVARFRRPAAALERWPVRSRALWAARLPESQARALVATAPSTRAHFVPEPGLLQLLRRITASPGGD